MLIVAGLVLLLLSVFGHFLINKGRAVCSISAVSALLFALPFLYTEIKWIFIAVAAVDLLALIIGKWTGYTIAALLRTVGGVFLFVTNISAFYENSGVLLGVLVSVVAAFELLFLAFLTFTAFFPGSVMRSVRNNLMHNGNTSSAEQKELVLSDGIRMISDIKYDDTLPNGYLDVYYPKDYAKGEKPTFVYIHGGGYIWGDKVCGDPTGAAAGFENSTIYELVNAGYAVVSMNYALAPEYTYPCAIHQLNRGLAWLKENSDSLKLNMDAVVLSGASAGGNLAGVLANIQTNPVYAKSIEASPVFQNGEIKAVVFEGGLMDNCRFGVTHNAAFDYVFYHMGRVYLKVNELLKNKKVKPSNVIDHVTENFPSSFISDGNTATFFDQARALEKRLSELGVHTQLSIYPVEQAGKLIHGFEESDSAWGKETRQNIVAFLEQLPG